MTKNQIISRIDFLLQEIEKLKVEMHWLNHEIGELEYMLESGDYDDS